MAGKHEPPTKTTFYISLATSTLRAAILVAALVVGVFVLAKAFGGDNVRPSVAATPRAGGSPTSPAPRTTTPPPPTRTPQVKGVVVQVLNGTSTTGLAGATTEILDAAGYSTEEPDDADHAYDRTIVYYQRDSKVDAEFMRDKHFKNALLRPAPATLPQDIQITVVLGADYSPPPTA